MPLNRKTRITYVPAGSVCWINSLLVPPRADDANHEAVKTVVEDEPGPLLVPVVLLAEIDYLLGQRLGVDATLVSGECGQQGIYAGGFDQRSILDFTSSRGVVQYVIMS